MSSRNHYFEHITKMLVHLFYFQDDGLVLWIDIFNLNFLRRYFFFILVWSRLILISSLVYMCSVCCSTERERGRWLDFSMQQLQRELPIDEQHAQFGSSGGCGRPRCIVETMIFDGYLLECVQACCWI